MTREDVMEETKRAILRILERANEEQLRMILLLLTRLIP